MKKFVGMILICAGPIVSQAACPTWPAVNQPNSRFTLNDNGTEVKDNRTGLVWRRCSEGQILSVNTCTGSSATYTHAAALANAQKQSGWRLPNVKELAGLADKGCANPAIDSSAFPNTPSTAYWTSSPYVGRSGDVWNVSFYDGGVDNDGPRETIKAVRLVRASK